MAYNPNTTFSSGAVYTADQANRFPRGAMASATSTTNYTLTTTETIATGMSVSFTAVSTRAYKITYYEPLVSSGTITAGAYSYIRIRNASATGTLINQGTCQTLAAGQNNYASIHVVGIVTGISGSVTYVGSAVTFSTTGTPILARSAGNQAYIIVEDIGPA
jgi:hypothetical protein